MINKILFAAAIIGIAAALFILPNLQETEKLTITNSEGKKITIYAEIADDDKERITGLSERKTLAANKGMIFVFDKEQLLGFWMQGMEFPLDMVFFDSKMNIVDI